MNESVTVTFEDLTLSVRPDPEHDWLLSNAEAAAGMGATVDALYQLKRSRAAEYARPGGPQHRVRRIPGGPAHVLSDRSCAGTWSEEGTILDAGDRQGGGPHRSPRVPTVRFDVWDASPLHRGTISDERFDGT